MSLNYTLSSKELVDIHALASGTEIAQGFHPLQKSLCRLLANLIQLPNARWANHEPELLSGRAWWSDRPGRCLFTKVATEDEAVVLAKCYRAVMMFERIRLLYSSLGDPLPTLKCGTKDLKVGLLNILQWSRLYLDGKAERIAKYQSVSVFNMLTKTEPLEAVQLPFSWRVGQLSPWYSNHRRVIRLLQRTSNREIFFSKAQAFLYFKKGCPPAMTDFIQANLEKHEKALTAQQEKISYVTTGKGKDTGVVSRLLIKKRIRAICQSVFNAYEQPRHWWEPSMNACFGTRRSNGGQMSEIEIALAGHDNWTFHDTGYSVIKVPIAVEPVLRLTDRIFAKPIALTEPLKVRVITAETSWSTYALAGAQQALWKCLKRHPWFALTGRPCTGADIPVGEKSWISVDYSAATDNLKSDMSKMVIEAICDITGLPFELCYESLCEHLLVYGDYDPTAFKIPYTWEEVQRKRGTVEQKNGQLMGSILSFIVLCIANATVITLAMDPESYANVRNESLLVNGDDGLFLGDDTIYENWKSISFQCGLEPSIGKVYKSSEFCVINSQLYARISEGVMEIPYANASAMMRFDAKSYSTPRSVLDLADAGRLWMSGFPEGKRKKFWDLWMQELAIPMLTDLEKQPKNRRLDVQKLSLDWHLPQELGGLGIPMCAEDPRMDVNVGRLALSRARWCIRFGKCWREYRRLPKDMDDFQSPEDPFSEPKTWTRLVTYKDITERDREVCRSLFNFEESWLIKRDPLEDNLDPRTGCKVRKWEPLAGTSRLAQVCGNFMGDFRSVQPWGESVLEGNSQYRHLLKSKAAQGCWWNCSTAISYRDVQHLNIIRGSRKIRSYKPLIPSYDLLEGKHYNKWLRNLQDQRLGRGCSGPEAKGANGTDSLIQDRDVEVQRTDAPWVMSPQ